MGAITDSGELANAQQQLGPSTPQNAPAGLSPSGGAIVDPGELAHVQAQLAAPSTPALPVNAAPLPGANLTAAPDRGWLGTVDDAVRLAMAPNLADRFAAGMDTLTGTGLPGANYGKNLANEQARTKQAETDHPILSKILEPAGALSAALAVGPTGGIASGASMLSKMLYGAGTGAASGAVTTASRMPDLTAPGAAQGVAKGAALGAATGATVPIAAGVIGSGYSGIADAITGGAQGISRPVANQLVRTLGAQGVENTQGALDRLGPQAMLADTGEGMRAKAQGAAIYNPEGRVIVSDALNNRDAGTNGRLAQGVSDALGPAPHTPLQIDASIKAMRGYEHSALPDIFANAPPVDTGNVLATIGQGLTKAVGPEAAVLSKAKSYLMKSSVDAEGNPTVAPVTDAETLQNAKMAIDTLIDRGDLSLGIPPGAVSKAQGAIGAVRAQLNGALRDQVPGYGDVMDRSAALARKADAIETGYNDILGGGKSALNPADLNDRLAAASQKGPEVLEGYKIGLRAAIDRATGTNTNDLVALRRQLGDEGDWNRSNMASILGARPTNALVDVVDRNSAFRDTKNSIMSGAKTAWATQALNELKPNAGTDSVPFFNPSSTATGMLTTAATYPFRKAWQMVGDQFAHDPYASHGELARVLTAQGGQRDAYLSALAAALARRGTNAATGQAVGNNAALAAGLIGGNAANQWLAPPQPSR